MTTILLDVNSIKTDSFVSVSGTYSGAAKSTYVNSEKVYHRPNGTAILATLGEQGWIGETKKRFESFFEQILVPIKDFEYTNDPMVLEHFSEKYMRIKNSQPLGMENNYQRFQSAFNQPHTPNTPPFGGVGNHNNSVFEGLEQKDRDPLLYQIYECGILTNKNCYFLNGSGLHLVGEPVCFGGGKEIFEAMATVTNTEKAFNKAVVYDNSSCLPIRVYESSSLKPFDFISPEALKSTISNN